MNETNIKFNFDFKTTSNCSLSKNINKDNNPKKLKIVKYKRFEPTKSTTLKSGRIKIEKREIK